MAGLMDAKALALLGLALDQLRESGCSFALAEAEQLWDGLDGEP